MRTRFFLPSIAAVMLLPTLSGAERPPFQYTEVREPCEHFDPMKQPFFGELHNHTARSMDAAIRFVKPGPRQSFNFMKKSGPAFGVIRGIDQFGIASRLYQIDRPLDFGAVTDHSELFGEVGICTLSNPNDPPPGYHSLECNMLRNFYFNTISFPVPEALRVYSTAAFTILTAPSMGPSSFNTRLPVCVDANGVTKQCLDAELDVWHEVQNAAEDAYDRTKACSFTSFIAYENTSTPSGNNWHRNVIFRNANVIDRPVTAIDMAIIDNRSPETRGPIYATIPTPNPRKFWRRLRRACLRDTPGCDVAVIPHNSNLGGKFPTDSPIGIPALWLDPIGLTQRQRVRNAKLRASLEIGAEIYQDKGGSECRFDPRTIQKFPNEPWRAQTGLSPFDAITDPNLPDEACSFEILEGRTVIEASAVASFELPPAEPDEFDPKAYLRGVFKDGLRFGQDNGFNPFKMAIGASTDNHNAAGGWNPENPFSNKEKGLLSGPWNGHLGVEDANMTRTVGASQSSTGGKWVVWAEENSRDSIFTGLKKKETYGTSGPRHRVRFFGSFDFPVGMCARPDKVGVGYRQGVPMGGDLDSGDLTGPGASPSFVLEAHWDDHLQQPLQQVQIIKGWVDGNGETHEALYKVGGDPNNGASVDTDCNPIAGTNDFQALCASWTDPDFDPSEPAFYYARVLENPVCRVSTHICQQNFGVNPLLPLADCEAQLAALAPGPNDGALQQLTFENASQCCNQELTETFQSPTIQERSWTTPIWYTP